MFPVKVFFFFFFFATTIWKWRAQGGVRHYKKMFLSLARVLSSSFWNDNFLFFFCRVPLCFLGRWSACVCVTDVRRACPSYKERPAVAHRFHWRCCCRCRTNGDAKLTPRQFRGVSPKRLPIPNQKKPKKKRKNMLNNHKRKRTGYKQ